MKHMLTLALCFVWLVSSHAQKALMLEKSGSFKTTKFYIGDPLVYKLKSDKDQWLREYITEIYVDDGLLGLENRVITVDSIYAIRTGHNLRWAKTISHVLTAFAGSWSFWTLVSLAYGDPLALGTVAVGVGTFAVAQLLRLLYFKTHKIRGNKRLRLIDLNFYNTPKSAPAGVNSRSG